MAAVSLGHVDPEAFGRDLDALRAEAVASIGEADLRHLRRFEIVGRLCTVLGYATAWIFINPISALLISLGNFVRWAVFMHHVGHRAYDDIEGAPARFTSRRFGHGWRRFIDWFDWIPPEAWIHEHNALHHTRTNEEADPDFVQRNIIWFRKLPGPRWLRYASVIFIACTWKVTYFAPSAMRVLQLARLRRAGQPSRDDSAQGLRFFYDYSHPEAHRQWAALTDPRGQRGREFWFLALLPYAAIRFVLMPLAFAPLGTHAVLNVLVTSLIAEVLTNIHSFVTIVTNHAGEDLAHFSEPATGRYDFYLRQASAAVNFTSPGVWSDFLHGGLNFHIEHHLWPDLPLSKYRELAPRVRAICEKHGVPYREESVVRRIGRLVDLFLCDARQDPARLPDGGPEALAA
jgi:fatty acid desaturase